jgi:hypothetical protein
MADKKHTGGPGQHEVKTRCQLITEGRLRAQSIRAAASKVSTHERLDDLMEAVDNEE